MVVMVRVEEKSLTPQSQRLIEFHDRVADVLVGDYEFTEDYLGKWLRRNDNNTNKAEAALRNYKSWSVKKMLDNGEIPKFDEIAGDLPIEYCGFDKEGCPVLLVRVGKWNVPKYSNAKHKDEFIAYITNSLESSMKILKQQYFNTNGVTNLGLVGIIDMEGFSLLSCVNKDTIKGIIELVKILETFYPEIGKSFYVVNLNGVRIANMMLKIISPFMAKETMERIHIYGKNKTSWKEIISNIVPDVQQFPEEFRKQLVTS